MTKTNSKFSGEQDAANRLMQRLWIAVSAYVDPNKSGKETGVDVIAITADSRIGIQVTELDTGTEPGVKRGQEVRCANQFKEEGHGTYGFWAQNDPVALVAAITRAIERKVGIAAQHDFASLNSVWLLVACGVPVSVGTVSTIIMTPWIAPDDLSTATQAILTAAKYDRVFVYSILGVEEKALYQWDSVNGWRKDVPTPDPRTMGPSVFDVLKDPEWLTNTEQRFAQEVEQVLQEFRGETIKAGGVE